MRGRTPPSAAACWRGRLVNIQDPGSFPFENSRLSENWTFSTTDDAVAYMNASVKTQAVL